MRCFVDEAIRSFGLSPLRAREQALFVAAETVRVRVLGLTHAWQRWFMATLPCQSSSLTRARSS